MPRSGCRRPSTLREDVRRTEGIPIQIRVGVNSGKVVVRPIGSDGGSITPSSVDHKGRCADRADGGAGSISCPNTFALAEGYVQVRPLGPMEVKALSNLLKSRGDSSDPLCALGCTLPPSWPTHVSWGAQRMDELERPLGAPAMGTAESSPSLESPEWASPPRPETRPLASNRGLADRSTVRFPRQSDSVSAGYRPAAGLLPDYAEDEEEVRETNHGKLLSRWTGPWSFSVSASLALDVPVEDPQSARSRRAAAAQASARWHQARALRKSR